MRYLNCVTITTKRGFNEMTKIEKSKGGNHIEVSKKYKSRFRDGGKFCNKCKKVRKLDEYYTTASICKICMLELNRQRSKKKNKPLW